MRKLILPLVFFFSSPLLFASTKENFKIISEDENGITVEYNLSSYSIGSVTVNGISKNFIKAENTLELLEKGFPAVRKSAASLQIPNTGSVAVTVVSEDFSDIAGIDLLPSKGDLKRNTDPSSVLYEYGAQYGKNEFYPAAVAGVSTPYIFRNTRGSVLTVSPFLYNAVTKTLRVYSKVVIRVEFNNEVKGENELAQANPVVKGEKQIAERHFINYNPKETRYTPVEENGSMLVICHGSFQTATQPFIDWKNQEGIKTTMVSVSTIGNNQSAINTYIENYYNANPDLLYVLLVGDHAEVNSYNAGMAGSEIKWSDSYYGLISGNDHYPEVFVGRFSASTSADITTMVNRTLEYEKTPSAGNWYHKAIGIGSDQGAGIGDDGEADWEHERLIGQKLTTWGYTTFYEFFDGSHGGNDASGDPNSTMVSNAVNGGVSLFFYTGHGAQNVCVTSNYSSTDVDAATNNGMYPFVVSVACNNGTFTSGSCLAEVFLTSSNGSGPTGGINACGSSILMSWAPPMETQDEIVEILTDQYVSNKKVTTGGLFYNGQMSMLDNYNNNTGRELMETWVMFGDPSLMLRTKTPAPMTVSHAGCFDPAASDFSVTCSANGARASVSQNNVLIGSAIVSGGVANIILTAPLIASDPLMITVTGYNRSIYQQSVNECISTGINENAGAFIYLYPNPVEDALTVNLSGFSSIQKIEVLNAVGQVVKTIASNSNQLNVPVSDLAKGMYTLKVTADNSTVVKSFIR